MTKHDPFAEIDARKDHTDWDAYARSHPINEASYRNEHTQWLRVRRVLERCVGDVLDVGGADGFIAYQLLELGHNVTMVEASALRCERARALGVPVWQLEALTMVGDDTFDTVLLGEVLEHLEDPGALLVDAFRIARERVVITVPLRGWPDPTHRWRISLDVLSEPGLQDGRPQPAEQIVLTMQKGDCWDAKLGVRYWETDEKWHQQFDE